jgi:hypothetical protein
MALPFPKGVTQLRQKKEDPPPKRWVFVNVDTIIFQKDNRMGLCTVTRDYRGDFLAIRRQEIDRVSCPEMAEALALRRAV